LAEKKFLQRIKYVAGLHQKTQIRVFPFAAQSSRLAEYGGRGMSFKICRGTLGSLAMFTATRNASSHNGRTTSSAPCSSTEE